MSKRRCAGYFPQGGVSEGRSEGPGLVGWCEGVAGGWGGASGSASDVPWSRSNPHARNLLRCCLPKPQTHNLVSESEARAATTRTAKMAITATCTTRTITMATLTTRAATTTTTTSARASTAPTRARASTAQALELPQPLKTSPFRDPRSPFGTHEHSWHACFVERSGFSPRQGACVLSAPGRARCPRKTSAKNTEQGWQTRRFRTRLRVVLVQVSWSDTSRCLGRHGIYRHS